MRLDSVHSLKQEIRDALVKRSAFLDGLKSILPFIPSGLPFAIGARLMPTEGDYRLAIRLRHRGAWVHLWRPALAKVLRPVEKELDVQVIGPVRFSAANPLALAANPALRIGATVRHTDGARGTLGFFAKRGPRSGIVSCNHVLALIDQGRQGDRIIGPSVELTLDGLYPLLKDPAIQFKLADCAFAAFVNGDAPQDPARLDGSERLLETPLLPEKEMPVKKIGAASGPRTGTVVVRDLDGFSIEVDNQLTTDFNDVLEIHSDNAQRRFSRDGDSGSLVYSAGLQPIGLLFADTATGGAFNKGRSFANRFDHVTTGLGVTLDV